MPKQRSKGSISRALLAKKLSKQVIPKISGHPEDEGGAQQQEAPTLESLLARVEALEEKAQILGEVFNQNTDVFAAGFDGVDRRLYTMMRVLRDMYFNPGKIHLKTEREVIREEGMEPYIHGGRTIDWLQYFAEYDAMLGLKVLIETHCKSEQEELPDNVVIFGGEDK